MIHEVILPKLGQTVEEASIVEWLKEEGDPVERGDVLFTVETDKATLEVEATTKGYLRKILVPVGVTTPVLKVVALITRTTDEDISNYDASKPSGGGQEETPPEAEEAPAADATKTEPTLGEGLLTEPTTKSLGEGLLTEPQGRIFASPRARKYAREHSVNLALVEGTGPNGRIVEQDVKDYIDRLPDATPVALRLAQQARTPDGAPLDLRTIQGTGPQGRITKADVERALAPAEEAPAPVSAPAPAAEPAVAKAMPDVLAEVPMSGVRAVIAEHMHASHQATAPLTLTMEVDATKFVTLRERLKARMAGELGFNIGYNDLLIKLVSHALRKFPYMNARLEEDKILHLGHVHVALAVDTPRGLLVPFVRDADQKRLSEVAQEVRGLVERARTGKSVPDELSGSTFTITNLGMFEIDAFTPLINLPEVAIMGVGRIKDRPAVVDGELCVRKIMWMSLTIDHRLVDGAPAARFLQYIKNLIEDPYLWLAASM